MALDKTYSIRCESTDVHMRRAMNDRPQADAKEALDATRDERVELRRGCKGSTATEYTAKPKIIPDHIPAPVPPVHCKECNADLTQEAGLWVDAKSGDHGGTYDHCPMSSDHVHSPAR